MRSLLLFMLGSLGMVGGLLFVHPLMLSWRVLEWDSVAVLATTLGFGGCAVGVALAHVVDICLYRLADRGSVRWPT